MSGRGKSPPFLYGPKLPFQIVDESILYRYNGEQILS